MQRESKWLDRFYKLWTELRLKDNTTFEEVPADIQMYQFIGSEITRAVAEERERIVDKMCQVREDWKNGGQFEVLPTADYLINLIK